VKLAAACALLGGNADLKKAWAQRAPAGSSSLQDLPGLDGEVLFSDADRQAAAADNGGHVNRAPVAVLRPRTTDDVVRMVGYANKHSLKIAMRGRGHSQYGQSQVERGIVIDSSTLNIVRLHGTHAIDAQPGALWGDVSQAALAKNLIPPVMVDSML
jgi:cytokinin dehydrogenase